MKLKSVLVVAVLACCSTVGFSQIKFGAKLGLNVSSLKFSDEEGDDSKSRLAPVFGGLAEYSLSDKFALQGELVFSGEGEVSEYTEDGVDYKETLALSYLNLPILAKYKLANGLSFLAGPQFGFLLSAKSKMEDVDVDVKEFLNGMNTSLAFGAAYEMESGLGFDLRYNMGLSNIAKDSGDETLKANTFQVSAFYKF